MVPFNTPCILASMYGPDYLTPATKGSYLIQQEAFSKAGQYSECMKEVAPNQAKELDDQLSFCQEESFNAVISAEKFWVKRRNEIDALENRKKFAERQNSNTKTGGIICIE